MINDNPKPNKVDMCGIQKKGIGGDFSNEDFKFIAFFFFIVFVVVAVMQPKQKNNTHTIDCKTKVAPKI
jgi:hypothetical protein